MILITFICIPLGWAEGADRAKYYDYEDCSKARNRFQSINLPYKLGINIGCKLHKKYEQ